MQELARRFLEVASRQGDSTALTDESGRTVTYEQLARESQTLAECLERLGVANGDRVALCLPKSFVAVAVILAILRRGAAYVPVDVAGAVPRNAQILAEAEPKLIIAENERDVPAGWTKAAKFSHTNGAVLCFRPAAAPETTRETVEPVYLLFTSGSTGKPKGVIVGATAALAFVDWAGATFAVGPTEVVASLAPLHFDLSVFDLFVTLTRGASLVLLTGRTVSNPRLLAQLLSERRVSMLYTTPSLLQLLFNHGRMQEHEYPSLRRILYAGEPYPVTELRKMMSILPRVRFANLYGPTETNVVTWYELPGLPPMELTDIPIGRACHYAELILWNDEHVVQPAPGVEAELLVAGTSVAIGYVRASEDTGAFLPLRGKRYYRTGDLVRVAADGNLIFAGRRDRMIKRRGYRIEPAEIESVLSAHPAVVRAAVAAVTTGDGGVRLVAYYVPASGPEIPRGIDLALFCKQHLPAYFIPDTFRCIDAIPLTGTQKTDYQKLQTLANV